MGLLSWLGWESKSDEEDSSDEYEGTCPDCCQPWSKCSCSNDYNDVPGGGTHGLGIGGQGGGCGL